MFDYSLVGNSYEMFYIIWVLENLEVIIEFGGESNEIVCIVYIYQGGLYECYERGFLGFNEVKEIQLDIGNGDVFYWSYIQYFVNDNYYE